MYIIHLYFVQYNVIIFGVVLSTFKRVATCIMVRYVPQPISIQFVFH